jgi:hypothetical protein
MIIKGRDKPYVNANMDETGVIHIRVDFELYPAGWADIMILNEDLEKLQKGEEISGKIQER